MPRKRHTPEQIIRRLREAEVELAKGQTTVEVVRKLGITERNEVASGSPTARASIGEPSGAITSGPTTSSSSARTMDGR